VSSMGMRWKELYSESGKTSQSAGNCAISGVLRTPDTKIYVKFCEFAVVDFMRINSGYGMTGEVSKFESFTKRHFQKIFRSLLLFPFSTGYLNLHSKCYLRCRKWIFVHFKTSKMD
jgi:hypothetical protein